MNEREYRAAAIGEWPTPKKGEHGGPCNRTTCDRPASWWSDVERAHYCPTCARHINEFLPPNVPRLVWRASAERGAAQ